MATKINIFKSVEGLSKKAVKNAKCETKKAVNKSLADFATAIEAAALQVQKSTDKRARDCYNAAKGRYGTALQIVQSCYPFQTAAGELLCKKKDTEGVKRYELKKLTAAAARGIVRESLRNFTDTLGAPVVVVREVGDEC